MAKRNDSNEIMLVDERTLEERVYIIRNQRVMISTDLAEIYGYEHKRFMEQVKNNSAKFDDDFMFQLTKDEFENLKSKNSTSSWGGIRKMPHAFTEQGIYMLMTVLRGDLAVEQSKMLIRLFKKMKDYVIQNRTLIEGYDVNAIALKTFENTRAIKRIEDNMVTKADLSDFMKLFDDNMNAEETLIWQGELLKADIIYQKIYKKAKKSIIVVDDYIGVKTLLHIAHGKRDVTRTIITDNRGSKPLRKIEYDDYLSEYPGREILFLKAGNKSHDRFIVIDYGTKDMKMYLCGSSSKDSGKKATMIIKLKEPDNHNKLIEKLLSNPELKLK